MTLIDTFVVASYLYTNGPKQEKAICLIASNDVNVIDSDWLRSYEKHTHFGENRQSQ